MKKYAIIAIILTLAALGFRLFIALRLPNDAPDDGRVYAHIARNVVEHGSYSMDDEEPYEPTYIRVPGYPIFLAGVYRIFGVDNNRAVRVVQAVIDSLTCWVIALLAFIWTPVNWDSDKRRRVLIIALGLAASSPFGAIYVATILTEVWAMLLVTSCVLTATLAIKSAGARRSALLWVVAGMFGGAATLMRPDSGFFVAAVGSTLVIAGLIRSYRALKLSPLEARRRFGFTVLQGLMLSIGFALALTPWTIRNARVFGIFQPLAPASASMPGDFVPTGYTEWLRTWVDDERYTDSFEYGLDLSRIHIEKAPSYAFDSPEERERVASLLDKYNYPDGPPPPAPPKAETKPPEPEKKENQQPEPAGESATAPTEADENSAEPAGDEEEPEDEEETDEEEYQEEEEANVQMTPELDAEFAEIARERIARHPLRFYLATPARRAVSLWFDTHSQYYPFHGWLLPWSSIDRDLRQQYWLPLFSALTWLYTLLAAAGVWVMWRGRGSRVWVVLLALLILPRLLFLSSLENPEPRYTVEFFILILAAGSIFLGNLSLSFLRRRQ